MFEALQKRDQIVDLRDVETEFGHRGVSRDDALGQRLREGLDRVALVELPERALADRPDRMALRTVRQGEGAAPLRARVVRSGDGRDKC